MFIKTDAIVVKWLSIAIKMPEFILEILEKPKNMGETRDTQKVPIISQFAFYFYRESD